MENLTGKYFGRYHIQKQLGEGGMATVYIAYDARLERSVAIKIIRTEQANQPSFLARFEREAKALAKLSHPNIVKVLDFGDQDGVPYLVMEYVPGGTLRQQFKGPIQYSEAARQLAPIARALDYAHHHKIIHRDIKPANILISETGAPMLSDFGIAKMLEQEEMLTGTGVGIGTPEYMAPEQGTGGHVDQRADIYALGIVFYEMISGRRPFQADTPLAVVYKQVNDPLPSPRLFVADIPEEAELILVKALAKNAEDRYQDMGLFAEKLEQLGQGKKPGFEVSNPAATLLVSPQKQEQGQAKQARLSEKNSKSGSKIPNAVLFPVLGLISLIILGCASIWLMYGLNICLPEGPWPMPPWCQVKIPPDYNRLVCPPPGPWPLPPWCSL